MKHNNVNRYAEFCQFRREIRGSVEYVIVGIDVAKERHQSNKWTNETNPTDKE